MQRFGCHCIKAFIGSDACKIIIIRLGCDHGGIVTAKINGGHIQRDALFFAGGGKLCSHTAVCLYATGKRNGFVAVLLGGGDGFLGQHRRNVLL